MLKTIIRAIIPTKLLEFRDLLMRTRPLASRKCSVCKYQGYFKNAGKPPRLDALCPKCGSLERHRLFWLWYQQHADAIKAPIMHFAPEKIFESKFKKIYLDGYKTADLYASADLKINIEQIDLHDDAFNTVICNHVLEHVDDEKALREIYRILSHDGIFIVSVPIVEGWDKTYENPEIRTDKERELHFGQNDHVRYYGKDFRERLRSAGFKFEEITAEGSDVVEYGLLRGEKYFICSKMV